MLLMVSQPTFADGLRENQYAFPEKGSPSFPRRWFLYTHYSILNKADDMRTKRAPAPCNYVGVGPDVDCYLEEVATIRLFLKVFPKECRKKGLTISKSPVLNANNVFLKNVLRLVAKKKVWIHWVRVVDCFILVVTIECIIHAF